MFGGYTPHPFYKGEGHGWEVEALVTSGQGGSPVALNPPLDFMNSHWPYSLIVGKGNVMQLESRSRGIKGSIFPNDHCPVTPMQKIQFGL